MGFVPLGIEIWYLPQLEHDSQSAPDRHGDGRVDLDGSPRAGGAERERGELAEPPAARAADHEGVAVDTERVGRPDPVGLAHQVPARERDPELRLPPADDGRADAEGDRLDAQRGREAGGRREGRRGGIGSRRR